MNERETLEHVARDASRCIHLANDTTVATVLGRFKMFLDTADIGLTPHLALDGFWESWVTCAMLRMVKPGMHVVNVGANIGYYALLFAGLVGSTGSVTAVEPNPKLCDLLYKSKCVNGYNQLTIVCAAASDVSGSSTLLIPKNSCGEAHLIDVPGPSGESVPTLLTTVDTLTKGNGIDLVFIDAEGAEEKIWDGMKQVRAKRDVSIVMEFTPRRYVDAAGFVKKFMHEGFELGFIDTDGFIKSITPEALVAEPEFTMAVLRRSR